MRHTRYHNVALAWWPNGQHHSGRPVPTLQKCLPYKGICTRLAAVPLQLRSLQAPLRLQAGAAAGQGLWCASYSCCSRVV